MGLGTSSANMNMAGMGMGGMDGGMHGLESHTHSVQKLDSLMMMADAPSSQDVKAMERKLDRQFRNPILVVPQLKLVNEVHMALSRAFSKSSEPESSEGSGSSTLYQPAEVVVSVVEKYGEDKDAAWQQRILPSMVHRLYINALIQRNKFDKAFVYATKLSLAIKGWRFAQVLDNMLKDVAYPKLRNFFDLALIQDSRRPWECQRLVQASLMLLRILHSCEHLPVNLMGSAASYMERFTQHLKKSLVAIYTHPKYDGTQTLEGVMEINRSRAANKIDSKRDAMDLVEYLKQQVILIREHGRGHQPLFPDKVNAFREILDRIETGIKDGTLVRSSNERSIGGSMQNARSRRRPGATG
mmetsp:Transcript_23546/g.41664  ORF Transcript_23546/g.41664 Transcript_23546/m.41664 type:complete len:356 (-) Transcript_23546:129-1196(-)